jgi:hypothetical protein
MEVPALTLEVTRNHFSVTQSDASAHDLANCRNLDNSTLDNVVQQVAALLFRFFKSVIPAFEDNDFAGLRLGLPANIPLNHEP